MGEPPMTNSDRSAPTTPLAVVVEALRGTVWAAAHEGVSQEMYERHARALLAKLAATADEAYQRGYADGERFAAYEPTPTAPGPAGAEGEPIAWASEKCGGRWLITHEDREYKRKGGFDVSIYTIPLYARALEQPR